MTKADAPLDSKYWSTLTIGQQLEICNDAGLVYSTGRAETLAPDIGIVWIRTDLGERKLLDLREDKVRVTPFTDA
jgi:hypothetical protein